MSLTFNKFKSTTIYGNFNNSDYADNSILANGQFDRDLTIKGNLNLGTEITNTHWDRILLICALCSVLIFAHLY
jgi:hypothetical protein